MCNDEPNKCQAYAPQWWRHQASVAEARKKSSIRSVSAITDAYGKCCLRLSESSHAFYSPCAVTTMWNLQQFNAQSIKHSSLRNDPDTM